LKIPDKIKGKNIKQIEIVPIYDGYKYKINYTYEIEKQKIEDTNKIEDCISIDLGMVNLMTIYDPTDEQYIIKGGKLISIIKHQNERINYYKKIATRVNGQATTKRINGIMIKKQNQMTNTINEIVNWIKKKYAHKKKIIIGYNEEWKKGTKMGKETNMKFQQIPYKTIINKIKNGMEKKGIKIETTEESYTSKCDALGMEEIKKQEVYMGKRTKRGLYKSSTGTKINADLNGAINIMRKYMKKHGQKMEEIKGKGLKNPRKTNLEIQKND
jgi:putative transposase